MLGGRPPLLEALRDRAAAIPTVGETGLVRRVRIVIRGHGSAHTDATQRSPSSYSHGPALGVRLEQGGLVDPRSSSSYSHGPALIRSQLPSEKVARNSSDEGSQLVCLKTTSGGKWSL